MRTFSTPSRPALRAAACGGRPRPADRTGPAGYRRPSRSITVLAMESPLRRALRWLGLAQPNGSGGAGAPLAGTPSGPAMSAQSAAPWLQPPRRSATTPGTNGSAADRCGGLLREAANEASGYQDGASPSCRGRVPHGGPALVALAIGPSTCGDRGHIAATVHLRMRDSSGHAGRSLHSPSSCFRPASQVIHAGSLARRVTRPRLAARRPSGDTALKSSSPSLSTATMYHVSHGIC